MRLKRLLKILDSVCVTAERPFTRPASDEEAAGRSDPEAEKPASGYARFHGEFELERNGKRMDRRWSKPGPGPFVKDFGR